MREFDASLVVTGVRRNRRNRPVFWFSAGVLAFVALAIAIGFGARP